MIIMAETLDKKALIALIASHAAEGFDEASITDEMIDGIFIPETNEPAEVEDEVDGNDSYERGENVEAESDDRDNNNSNSASSNEYSDEPDLENIDVSKLSPDARMIYDVFLKERVRHRRDEMNSMINASGVGESHKQALREMIELGISKEKLSKHIDGFKQYDNAESRVLGKSRVIPKNRVRTINRSKEKEKINIGSKEYGAFLASNKNI